MRRLTRRQGRGVECRCLRWRAETRPVPLARRLRCWSRRRQCCSGGGLIEAVVEASSRVWWKPVPPVMLGFARGPPMRSRRGEARFGEEEGAIVGEGVQEA